MTCCGTALLIFIKTPNIEVLIQDEDENLLGYSAVSGVRTASSIKAPMMEAIRTCETFVYFNENTRRYIPEALILHTRRRENLQSQMDRDAPTTKIVLW
jgi:hypothetical protein